MLCFLRYFQHFLLGWFSLAWRLVKLLQGHLHDRMTGKHEDLAWAGEAEEELFLRVLHFQIDVLFVALFPEQEEEEVQEQAVLLVVP